MLTQIILYIALVTMPPPITFGLPPCNGTTTGLTERYDSTTGTLYVDDCLDGIPIEENLQVVDMTTSVIVIMTRRGEVTVYLPQAVSDPVESRTPVQLIAPTTEINDAAAEEDRNVDCSKAKLFLDECLMGLLQ